MMPVLFGAILQYFFGITMSLTALFLILLVLVQRGRGGGLAGALGGAGGQSAFGAKAGDTFTKITVWVAAIWILLCVVGIKMLRPPVAVAKPANQAAPKDDNNLLNDGSSDPTTDAADDATDTDAGAAADADADATDTPPSTDDADAATPPEGATTDIEPADDAPTPDDSE